MQLGPFSLTVVFQEPEARIVNIYQLACHCGEAHAIVMPSVTDALLPRFAADYLDWWKGQPNRPAGQKSGD